ncbi:Domain of unknown function DUF1540 [Syntrophomonas zehnderi OL-4]|uniref:DUF1540 domain-containing protein n=1 Tax=Syntrophomonas zehnderi OL-4 TaxID=690567 RepID=A0A0E4C9G9_9FIRM|nr:DUF1540 domain-containing protein [Syntrophomonas zehnderi]CFY00142.1 Domain of unknown function DUF1540 [Syntrophomonas zehnderi OL-4]
MKTDQKIACSVNDCIHYQNDMCKLNSIQVWPCDDLNNLDHESMCFSYQSS